MARCEHHHHTHSHHSISITPSRSHRIITSSHHRIIISAHYQAISRPHYRSIIMHRYRHTTTQLSCRYHNTRPYLCVVWVVLFVLPVVGIIVQRIINVICSSPASVAQTRYFFDPSTAITIPLTVSTLQSLLALVMPLSSPISLSRSTM